MIPVVSIWVPQIPLKKIHVNRHMHKIGYRSGRVGVLATLVLLLSIVLFIGSLFWLSVNGPWGGGSLFGDDLFKPASLTPEEKDEVTVNTTDNGMNITTVIDDLKANGCVFTDYSGTYQADQTIQITYEEFKEKAVNRKIVFTAETTETTILLVTENEKLYEWRP